MGHYGRDGRLRANGFIAEVVDVDGQVRELGHDDVQILAAKLSGAVT